MVSRCSVLISLKICDRGLVLSCWMLSIIWIISIYDIFETGSNLVCIGPVTEHCPQTGYHFPVPKESKFAVFKTSVLLALNYHNHIRYLGSTTDCPFFSSVLCPLFSYSVQKYSAL